MPRIFTQEIVYLRNYFKLKVLRLDFLTILLNMGMGHSSEVNAYTYIETQDSNFFPGAWVTGVVKILVEKPTHIGQMNILLTCISESGWSDPGHDSKNKCYDKRVLSRTYFRVLNMENQLPQGHFEIPFNIQLPMNLIPSFTYEFINNYGKVEYYFEAIADNFKEVGALQTIVWMNKLPCPNKAIGPISEANTVDVRSCLCVKKGKAGLKATLNTNLALITDEFFTTIKVDNTLNKCSVTKITCALVRYTRLKARNHLNTSSRLSFVSVLETSRDVRILPGQSDVPEVIINMNLKENSDLWKMPTVESELVDCEYFLKVKLGFDNLIRYNTYDLQLPIELCNGRLAINTSLSLQPELSVIWNPTMLTLEPIQVRIYDHVQGEGRDDVNLDHGSQNGTENSLSSRRDNRSNGNQVLPYDG